jgi:hypothetical protein
MMAHVLMLITLSHVPAKMALQEVSVKQILMSVVHSLVGMVVHVQMVSIDLTVHVFVDSLE